MILIARDIDFAFGEFQIIRGLSLAVPNGKITGLIGPNGAGKSTLFAVLSGFEQPARGNVQFGGADVTRLSAVSRAQKGMGRTFQVPREFKHLTVLQNLMAAAPGQAGEKLRNVFFRPGVVRRQEELIRIKAHGILDFFNLTPVAEVPSGQLSGGQKKLLELGRALMLEPSIVLLDEPFAGVNPVLIETLARHIRELNRRGMTFLIIEHNLQALTALADEIHVMNQGTIIASGDPSLVLADHAVREAYMGGVL